MKRNNRARLENIVNQQQSSGHCISEHPHENIATYVAGIMFLAMLFLFSVGIFFMAEPGQHTAFAIVDFSNVSLDLKLGEKVSEVTDTMLDPQLREEFMMVAYICWILIVGIVNLYFVDREYRDYHKK